MRLSQCIWTVIFVMPSVKAAPDPVIVNINTRKVAHVLDEHFVSLTVNPTDLLLGRPFGMGMNSTLSILQGLSPAYIRLGGPDTNHYVFQTKGGPNLAVQSSDEFVITEDHWKSLNEIMKKAKLDVIACVSSGQRSPDSKKWDSRNALDLISFSNKEKINITWELGYELSGDDVSGAQAGKDISKLRTMLNAFPRYQSSRLIGPDIRSMHTKDDAEHVLDILVEAGPALDAITWHPRWPHVGAIIPLDSAEDGYVFPPDYLEWDKHQLNKILQRTLVRKPFWISELQGENTGSFAEGLILARRLALAAKLGIEVVMKKPNLNDISHPKPEYWVAVMHKKTLGRTLLDSRALTNQTDVTVVTHCTSNLYPQSQDGGITVFAINTGSSPHRTIIRGIGANKQSDEKVHQYLLTAGGNDESIFSQLTYLNGEPLLMGNNGELPQFAPKLKHLRQQMILKLPPYSIGFWVIPQAKVHLCRQQPESISDLLVEDRNVAQVLSTAQKGINNLRSINHLIVNNLLSPTVSPNGQVENSSEENALGKSKRNVREVNIEQLGQTVKRQVDELNEMMRAAMHGEVRNPELRQEDHEDRMRAAEEKINGIANDIDNFLGKADQENEFGKFLEMSGLKQDFGKLMVDERLSRGKRKLPDKESVSSDSKGGRQKRNSPRDGLSAEDSIDTKSNRGLSKKSDARKSSHRSNSVTNTGMEKINKELQEELLLREIAVLEKTEETLIDAIRNHKKKQELLDKKLRNELASIKDEKLATLLEMKYNGQRLPEKEIPHDDSGLLSALNKKLVELKDEFAQQYPRKRETKDRVIEDQETKEKDLKKEDPLEAFRAFLKSRKEKLAKPGGNPETISELRSTKIKSGLQNKQGRQDDVSTTLQQASSFEEASPSTTQLPLVSPPVRKQKNKEKQASGVLSVLPKKRANYSDKNDHNNSQEDESLLEITKRKVRNLYEGENETDEPFQRSQILLRKLLAPNNLSVQKEDGEDYSSLSSSVSEEEPRAESRENKSNGSGDSDEAKTFNSESNRSDSEKESSGEGTDFKIVEVDNHGIEPSTGEIEAPSFAKSLSEDIKSNLVEPDTELPHQAAKLPQQDNEPPQQGTESPDQVTKLPQQGTELPQENSESSRVTESLPVQSSQTPTESPIQDATPHPSSQVTAARKERTRRNTYISQGISRNNAIGSAKNDEYGGNIDKNTITKKKVVHKGSETNVEASDILRMAGSGVNVVLDDVIPEAYDQSVLKLEHLVLPDYLQNLANVVGELKIVGNIFKSLSGASINSLTDSSDHIQKIHRKRRDTAEIEKHLNEQETKELMQNLDGSHEMEDHQNHFDDQLPASTHDEELSNAHHELHSSDAETLLTEGILHEVMSEVAEDILSKEEAKMMNDSLREQPLNNSTGENTLINSAEVTHNKIDPIENHEEESNLVEPVTKLPPIGRVGTKSRKPHVKLPAHLEEDPHSPWLASTHNIIEHVIKNLMKKQEELEARKNKGKREIAHSGYMLQNPANFKLEPGKPLLPMPQTESINQFMRQLRPGVYVVPSKDMTNVHADQVNSGGAASGKTAEPSVMTLNIYYDKKKAAEEEEAALSQNYPGIGGNPKHPGWSIPGAYKPAHAQPAHLSAPSLPSPPQATRRFYEPRYPAQLKPAPVVQAPSYSFNPLPSYQPAPVQPKYDESYTLVGQEPRYDGYKLIPVTSFTPWTSRDNVGEGSTNDLDWDPEINNQEPIGNGPERPESKQENDGRWYMRRTMNEPPLYVRKEIPRTTKKSVPKQNRPNLSDIDKKRSIEPYWNRTIKEIFHETSKEPFWDFLKSPEESYSSYKSGEDDLGNYMSGEENDKDSRKSEKDLQKLRRKRSVVDSSIRKMVKRSAPFMTNLHSNGVMDNFDTKPFDEAWAGSHHVEDKTVPDYYLSGRIINFNGVPSRRRRDHNPLLTNEIYKMKHLQLPLLDSSRISHGVLPKSLFKQPQVQDSFEVVDEMFNLNENRPSVVYPPIEESIVKPNTGSIETVRLPKISDFDESAFRQFYDFAMQVFKSMTSYV